MKILGISAFYHDSAACLVSDGEVIAAAQEERFSRIKNDAAFPKRAVDFCLKRSALQLDDVDYIAFYEKPFLKFERLLETFIESAPRGFSSFARAMPEWTGHKLFQKRVLLNSISENFKTRRDWTDRLLFSEHHLSHAASAYFPSPFRDAAILTMDGVGEWATTTLGEGFHNRLVLHREICFPHSLGLLYSAFTAYLGFEVNSGEYKVMGLAPYGEPRFAGIIRDHLIDIREDGSFRLNTDYFNYTSGLSMTNRRFAELFGGEPKKPGSTPGQREMDLAASIQRVLEEVILKIAQELRRSTGRRNLCIAGGVALNCVANSRVAREEIFDDIWIQPAAGDAGGALGAALAVHSLMLGGLRHFGVSDSMKGALLGPSFTQTDIERELRSVGARFETCSEDEMLEFTAQALARGQIVGWHQGAMEFGPRALGARSILADPRSASTQSLLNQKIKFRESFRPFAPSVLAEDAHEWFELKNESPYMLFVADIAKAKRLTPTPEQQSLSGLEMLGVSRSVVPAITHVDFSARVQTVRPDLHPLYYRLLLRFKALTGCPVLVNTSFNVRDEPIVSSPTDAFTTFMKTGLDLLVVGNCLVRKEEQGDSFPL